MGQNKPGFYMKEGLKEVTKNMGDRPAFRKGDGFFSKIGKGIRTGARILGELGVQGLDLIQSDPGNKGRSSGPSGGYYEALENANRAKDFENKFFDNSRKLVNEGKINFTLADYLDDDGSGFFKPDARPNKGKNTSSKNRTTGGM